MPQRLEPEPLEPRTVIGASIAALRPLDLPLVAGMSLDPPTFHLIDCGRDPVHPAEVLVGFDAPSEWTAVVAMAGGRSPTCGLVVVAVAATRAGGRGALVGGGGCDPLFSHEPAGRLVDACVRCLGLATDPPPPTLLDVIRGLWLDRVMARAVGGGPSPTWSEVVRLHPAWTRRDRVSSGALARMEDCLARSRTWSQVRAAVADGRLPMETIDPTDARWMDDGMFARTVLAELPDTRVLRADLGDLLPDATIARIDRALDRRDEEAA